MDKPYIPDPMQEKHDRSRICVRHLDSSCLSSGDLNIRLYASIPKTCWYVILSSLIGFDVGV